MPHRKIAIAILVLSINPLRAFAVLSEALSSASGALFEASCQEKKISQIKSIKEPLACESRKKNDKLILSEMAIDSQEKIYMNWAAENQATAARCEKTRIEKFQKSKELVDQWVESAVKGAEFYQTLIEARNKLAEMDREKFYPAGSPEAEALRSNIRQVHQAKKALLSSINFSEHASIRNFLKKIYEEPKFNAKEREKWLRRILPQLLADLPKDLEESAAHLDQQRKSNEYEFDSKRLFANSDLVMSYMEESKLGETAAAGLYCRMDSRYGDKFTAVETGFTIGSFALEAPAAILAKLGSVTRLANVGRLLNRGSALLKLTAFSATTADAIRLIEDNCIGGNQMSFLGANRCERIKDKDFETQEKLAMKTKSCGLSIASSGLPVMALPFMAQAQRLAVDFYKEGSLAGGLAAQGKKFRDRLPDAGPLSIAKAVDFKNSLGSFNEEVTRQGMKVRSYSEFDPIELIDPSKLENYKSLTTNLAQLREKASKETANLVQALKMDLNNLKNIKPDKLSELQRERMLRLENCMTLISRDMLHWCVEVGHEKSFESLKVLNSEGSRFFREVISLEVITMPRSPLYIMKPRPSLNDDEYVRISKELFMLLSFSPGTKTSATAKFIEHKDFPQIFETLKKENIKLVLDPHFQTLDPAVMGFFDPVTNSIHVHPSTPFHIFAHEVDHALFDKFIKVAFVKAEANGGSSFKSLLTDAQIQGYGGKERIERIEELLNRGLPPPTKNQMQGLTEQLAVDQELKLLGLKRYIGKNVFAEMYGLINQQTDFDKIVAANTKLNEVQRKTYEENAARLGFLLNLQDLQTLPARTYKETKKLSFSALTLEARRVIESNPQASMKDFFYTDDGFIVTTDANGKKVYFKVSP